MISYVSDIQQIVGSERVLTSGHPLFHVRSLPVAVRDSGPEADILQSARGISGRQPFGGECRAAGSENARSGFTINIGVPAESGSRS